MISMSSPSIASDRAPSEVRTPAEIAEPAKLPTRFQRVAQKGCHWDLPRSFGQYAAADVRLSVRGAAPKCIIRRENDDNEWYIAKGAEKAGRNETFTELLNNQLGALLGFEMAHSGLVRVDGELRFVSRNFLRPDESLRHASVIAKEFFQTDLEQVGKKKEVEQGAYDVEMLHELIRETCGPEQWEQVFAGFVEMLTFDCLIGSMDRHMQNWGIVVTNTTPSRFRFAPIFDSARALLWDYPEDKLLRLLQNPSALTGYIVRACPRVGYMGAKGGVNHFMLLGHLLDRYTAYTEGALSKVTREKVRVASQIVQKYPFERAFTATRKRALLKVLVTRAEVMEDIHRKGGDYVPSR